MSLHVGLPARLAGVAVAAGLALTAGCGGSGGHSSASQQRATVAQITRNWTAFFSAQTPVSQKVGLLQNGRQFTALLTAQAKNPLAQAASARVTKVEVTGDTATVTYDIVVGGRAVLSGETGTAVLQDGVWEVSDATLCGLLEIELGHRPAGCA